MTGTGCPVGANRWDTLGFDYAAEGSEPATKVEAVQAWLLESNIQASIDSIRRAIRESETGGEGFPVMWETSGGFPAVLSLEPRDRHWFVTDASWCAPDAG